MTRRDFDIVLIGGSSGSINVIRDIMTALPRQLPTPVVVIVHRMKNVSSKLGDVLSSVNAVREPEDKELICNGQIYLAPQNFHLLIENDRSFSMDYSELVNYSRPSIDVTFVCAANVYRKNTLAILLSGANKDGAAGVATIIKNGGHCIVQDPETAESRAMPDAAIDKSKQVEILKPTDIINTLVQLFDAQTQNKLP
jgi:two-component system chemotaxis response regulator CheB